MEKLRVVPFPHSDSNYAATVVLISTIDGLLEKWLPIYGEMPRSADICPYVCRADRLIA
jgi:hypothetical protein